MTRIQALRVGVLAAIVVLLSVTGTAVDASPQELGVEDYVDKGQADGALELSPSGVVLHHKARIVRGNEMGDASKALSEVGQWAYLDAPQKLSPQQVWPVFDRSDKVLIQGDASFDVSTLDSGTYLLFLWVCDNKQNPQNCRWLTPRAFSVQNEDWNVKLFRRLGYKKQFGVAESSEEILASRPDMRFEARAAKVKDGYAAALHNEDNYGGQMQTVIVGDSTQLEMNDDASSLTVDGGEECRAVLFQHALQFSPTSDEPFYMIFDTLGGIGQILQGGNAGERLTCHADCTCESSEDTVENACTGLSSVDMPNANPAESSDWNDAASAVLVRGGPHCSATLYKNGDHSGRHLTVAGLSTNLRLGGKNDPLKSVKVLPGLQSRESAGQIDQMQIVAVPHHFENTEDAFNDFRSEVEALVYGEGTDNAGFINKGPFRNVLNPADRVEINYLHPRDVDTPPRDGDNEECFTLMNDAVDAVANSRYAGSADLVVEVSGKQYNHPTTFGGMETPVDLSGCGGQRGGTPVAAAGMNGKYPFRDTHQTFYHSVGHAFGLCNNYGQSRGEYLGGQCLLDSLQPRSQNHCPNDADSNGNAAIMNYCGDRERFSADEIQVLADLYYGNNWITASEANAITQGVE